jgi:hypothetical protein
MQLDRSGDGFSDHQGAVWFAGEADGYGAGFSQIG